VPILSLLILPVTIGIPPDSAFPNVLKLEARRPAIFCRAPATP
jgi:hypothetical protein